MICSLKSEWVLNDLGEWGMGLLEMGDGREKRLEFPLGGGVEKGKYIESRGSRGGADHRLLHECTGKPTPGAVSPRGRPYARP